jgi:hypothetical protein
MSSQLSLRVFRLAFGVLGIVAVVAQYVVFIDRGGNPVNFFSFFTILSNIYAAGVLLFGAWRGGEQQGTRGPTPRSLALIRGAAVLYMSVTGIVYAILLSGLPDATSMTLPWINAALHDVMPIVLVVDWLIDPPTERLPFRTALIWLAFPLSYLAYSLVRGAVVQWYPYPFLSPVSQGYGGVAIQSVIILAGGIALTWCIVALPRLGSGMRHRQRP